MLKFTQQGVAFFNSGQMSPILFEQASPMTDDSQVFDNKNGRKRSGTTFGLPDCQR